jgi:exodeoxyribonuclease VII small subunit
MMALIMPPTKKKQAAPRTDAGFSDKSDEPAVEELLDSIDAIITALEGEDLPLEQSIARYEEGMTLLKRAQSRLETAEQKIRMLSLPDDASAEAAPVTITSAAGDAAAGPED